MTRAKPIVIIKSPKRFLVNKENQELQQKIFDTFVEWTTWKLLDELYLSLMSVREKDREGISRRKYEEQARYRIYWMAIPHHTAFTINLKDLDERVKRELAKRHKELRDFIIKQAVEKIFEQVDSSHFLLSAKQYLKVRFED